MATISKLIFTFAILFFGIFGLAESSSAATINAASCEQADVQAAINSVLASGGGTVAIPPGDCVWTSGLTLNSATLAGASLSIIGSGRGVTNISGASLTMFSVAATAAYAPDFFRVSNMSVTSAGTGWIKLAYITNAHIVRIDHIIFKTAGGSSGGMFLVTKNVGKILIDNDYFRQQNQTGDLCYSTYLLESGMMYEPMAQLPPISTNNCYATVSDTTCKCDVGSTPHYRSSSISAGNTVVAKVNSYLSFDAGAAINNVSGSGTGKVQRIHVYIKSVGADPYIKVGSFSANGNILTSRATSASLAVHVGLNIFNAGTDFTAFEVNAGDYLGAYMNDCEIASGAPSPATETTTSSATWVLAGNHVVDSGADFGAPSGQNISLWASIYDNEGILQTCEQKWNDWWYLTTPTRVAGLAGYDRAWNENYKPTSTDDQGWFIEDNTFEWVQSSYQGNWASNQKVTIRHNEFNSPQLSCDFVGSKSQYTAKPGGLFQHVYDNVFNVHSFSRKDISFVSGSNQINMDGSPNYYADFTMMFAPGDTVNITGTASNNGTKTIVSVTKNRIIANESLVTEAAGNMVNILRTPIPASGDAINHFYQSSGLVYDNIINNHAQVWKMNCMRQYSEFVFTPITEQKHLNIWNNTANGLKCEGVQTSDPNSLACTNWMQTDRYNGLCSYNGTYFFNAPQLGDVLYGYGQYPYPHPLQGSPSDTTPPAAPSGLSVQ